MRSGRLSYSVGLSGVHKVMLNIEHLRGEYHDDKKLKNVRSEKKKRLFLYPDEKRHQAEIFKTRLLSTFAA